MTLIITRTTVFFSFKKLNKYEDEARTKAGAADEQYKQQLSYANSLRKDYFEEHLPKMLSVRIYAVETDKQLLRHQN